MSPTRLFNPHGQIDRLPYLALGLVLVAAKIALDATLSRVLLHQPWRITNYLWPQFSILRWDGSISPLFVTAMLTVAAPFAWVGVCLTTQRLRALRAPIWLVVLFFVPLLKFILFALLTLLPSRPDREAATRIDPPQPYSGLGRCLPHNALGNAALAVTVAALIGCGFAAISIHWQHAYLAGLFIGAPFAIGFIAALLHEVHGPRRLRESVGVALLAILLVGVILIAVAFEGLVCVLMAAPLALCEAVAGAVVAHAFSDAMRRHRFQSFLSIVTLLPLFMLAETGALPPPLLSVRSEIVVDATPAEVWPHVIGFSVIPEPNEWIFRIGIAYPIRARIDGHGVGALRHCIFSTGEFVEPITFWDEPARLAFDVAAQPDPLQEVSPYQNLRPTHLRGYFESKYGEFRLIALPGGRTLLRGTTWYSDRIAPQSYWQLWSDCLIHRIHLRVLEHIRDEVERSHDRAHAKRPARFGSVPLTPSGNDPPRNLCVSR